MDSPADNLAFKDKFNFPYDLLSDSDKSMSIAYGAAEADSPRPARISVLVGPDGKVAAVYPSNPSRSSGRGTGNARQSFVRRPVANL